MLHFSLNFKFSFLYYDSYKQPSSKTLDKNGRKGEEKGKKNKQGSTEQHESHWFPFQQKNPKQDDKDDLGEHSNQCHTLAMVYSTNTLVSLLLPDLPSFLK